MVDMCLPAPFIILHGPHTHLQLMPSSALCDDQDTMWDEVEVQRSVSYGITLKFPCPA